MWDVTNEYRLFRNDPWAEQMGAFVKECDPYDHLTSVHGHETFDFRVSPWADYAMYQRWDEHGGISSCFRTASNRPGQAAPCRRSTRNMATRITILIRGVKAANGPPAWRTTVAAWRGRWSWPAATKPPASAPTTRPAARPPAPVPAAPSGPQLTVTNTPAAPDHFGLALYHQRVGNFDLALNGFTDYLRSYGETVRAPEAQFYIGEIHYLKGEMPDAIKAFDLVLERYQENPKTPDAHFMKGMALLKTGRRKEAQDEFRTLIRRFPNHELSGRAKDQLAALGMPVAPPSKRK